MAFPTDPLDLTYELNIGGVWTDITDDVYQRDTVTIKRGRPDETSTADPAKLTLTINNRSGKYSPRNPTSPYFGQLGRNTPIRQTILPASPGYALMPIRRSAIATADKPAVSLSTAADVRIEFVPHEMGFSTQSPVVVFDRLIAGQAFGPDRVAWQLWFGSDSRISFRWSRDGTFPSSNAATSTVAKPMVAGQQIALRATWVSDNGSGQRVYTFYTADSLDGPWVQLGDLQAFAGTETIFDVDEPLRIGGSTTDPVSMVGKVTRFELRSGIDGPIVASPDFRDADPSGAITDAQGNEWSPEGVASLVNPKYRFSGEVASWPQRWDKSENDVWVPITANGIRRRLGQGQPPVLSPMRRYLPSTLPGVVAYWPFEENTGAQQLSAGVAGVADASFGGNPQFGAAPMDGLPGSAALPLFTAGSSWRALIPTFTVDTRWSVDMVFRNISDTISSDRTVLSIGLTGSVAARLLIQITTAGELHIEARDADGLLLASSTSIADPDLMLGQWARLHVDGQQSALFVATIAEVSQDNTVFAIANVDGADIGRPVSVTVSQLGDVSDTDRSWGHVMVRTGPGSLSLWPEQITSGFTGETAADRIGRLAAENDVPLRIITEGQDADPMGPQPNPATFLEVIEDCAVFDGGVLTEPRDMLGLLYVTRRAMYSPVVAATVDYAEGTVWAIQPVDDDRFTRNDVTVKRDRGGSQAHAVLETGPLSLLPPPDGVGQYEDSVTVNALSDDLLPQHASWRLSLGTVDEARFPVLGFNLATDAIYTDPELTAALRDLDVGQKLRILNPPDWMPDTIYQLTQGFTEEFDDQFSWTIEVNCVPASPWHIAIVDHDGELGRLDTAGAATTGQFVAGTDTIMTVATTVGPLWTTDPAEFPFLIRAAGVVLEVTTITGATSPQTFTITPAPVNGVIKTIPAGSAVALAHPVRAGL